MCTPRRLNVPSFPGNQIADPRGKVGDGKKMVDEKYAVSTNLI